MIIVTTPTIEGRKITRYYGLVSGDAILGANAVVGVDLDYETITVGGGGGMLMVSCSGTAVDIQ